MSKTIYKICRLILSTFIVSSILINAGNLAALVITPILFDGAVGGTVIVKNSSSFPATYYVNDTGKVCVGVWSCSKLICDLYAENNPRVEYVAIRPRYPHSMNRRGVCSMRTHEIYEYEVFQGMMGGSIAALIATIVLCLGLIFEMHGQEVDKYSLRYKILFVIYCLLKLLILITLIILHTYLIPNVQIDHPPQPIRGLENLESVIFAIVYVIDSCLLPYEILI